MSGFLREFRFTQMPLVEFIKGPADSGLLTLAEVVQVCKFFSSGSPPILFDRPHRASPTS